MEEKKYPENNNEDKNNKEKIEIVKGNGKDLNISKVSDNLAFEIEDNGNSQKPNKKIVIPNNQKDE